MASGPGSGAPATEDPEVEHCLPQDVARRMQKVSQARAISAKPGETECQIGRLGYDGPEGELEADRWAGQLRDHEAQARE